jgi:hypothetical protein
MAMRSAKRSNVRLKIQSALTIGPRLQRTRQEFGYTVNADRSPSEIKRSKYSCIATRACSRYTFTKLKVQMAASALYWE